MHKKVRLFVITAFLLCIIESSHAVVLQSKDEGYIAGKLKIECEKREKIRKSYTWRISAGAPFAEYEKLVFNVMWKFITVGEASLELRGFEDIEGRKALHIYSYAKTKPFFDNFFKVRDTNESWLDEESKTSLRYVSIISEGGWKKYEILYFNQPEKTFLLNDSGKMKKGEITENVQDVLSALYYMRTLDIEVGEKYVLDAHSGDLSWPLVIKVLRKEKVKVPLGEFDCFVLEPNIRENAGIMNAKGKMLVWVTADKKKMPVYLKVKIPIGSINAKLERIEIKNSPSDINS
ncbi:MAG: DUF3108 domain-containing protein [Endomicrobium sp.]|jgi:hypothetical protein|nr:DUF3108 domain-containing protein [Endomicrobium sp.]